MEDEHMRYERPRTAIQAAELLSAESGVARDLAGSTDVMVQLRSGVAEPDLIVDIKHIGRMREVMAEAGGFRVGAAVSGAEPIGTTQIQGRATMAGNLSNGSPAADAVPGLFTAGAIARIAGPDGERGCPVEPDTPEPPHLKHSPEKVPEAHPVQADTDQGA